VGAADPDRASNWHSQDLCEIASYEEMGYLVVDRSHEDPVRHRYLQKHVHAAVFESMCQWDRDRSQTPAAVGEAGMLWLQRLLVDRDSVRRRYFDAPDYGPSGLGGHAGTRDGVVSLRPGCRWHHKVHRRRCVHHPVYRRRCVHHPVYRVNREGV
jgi:hypothetical protein